MALIDESSLSVGCSFSYKVKMEKMLRFAALAILCAAVCAVSVIGEPNSADFGVDVVESIDKYLAQNPEIEFLHEMDGKFMDDRQQFRYSHGRRLQGKRKLEHNYATSTNNVHVSIIKLFIIRRSTGCQ